MPILTDTPSPAAIRAFLFIDSRVPDPAAFTQAAAPGTQIVLLQPGANGLRQIAEALAGSSDLDSISIVSHGTEGLLLLGDGPLFGGNIHSAGHAADLASIGAALSNDGDIWLYGCDVGAGALGQAFIAALAQATGADIAASSNTTGLGGDWSLEVASGSIESPPALDAPLLGSYGAALITTSVSTVAQLKAAIATGSTDGVADVITLTGDITFVAAADTISINVTDGQTMALVGGGFTINADSQGRVMTVNSSGFGSAVEIGNMTLQRGSLNAFSPDALGAGILHQSGNLLLNGVTVMGNISFGVNGSSGMTGMTGKAATGGIHVGNGATLTVLNSSVNGTGIGGNGGRGSLGNGGDGGRGVGAISNDGTVLMDAASFTALVGNSSSGGSWRFFDGRLPWREWR